jgi:hypothetical protein
MTKMRGVKNVKNKYKSFISYNTNSKSAPPNGDVGNAVEHVTTVSPT